MRMSQSAWAFEVPPLLLPALEEELDTHISNPLSCDAAKDVPSHVWDMALGSPLREFLNRPGKEFRGELSKIFFRLVNDQLPVPEHLPMIVEALHAGSLIVDDIQDASVERRGKASLHRMYGVPLALNAGNWLYFWATDLLASLPLAERERTTAQRLLNRCLLDCHYGQALDLSQRVSSLKREELPAIVRATTELKSGSLLALAAGLGALAGGASDEVVVACHRFGRDMGTALQMLDDLSGILSPRKLSKAEEDLRNDSPTWLWAWLATSQSPDQFARFRKMGAAIAEGGDPGLLIAELRLLFKGHKSVVREHLDVALARLQSHVPRAKSSNVLHLELERLERMYV
jgi:geranylgeranyl pyrophosphate synthase